MAARKNTGSKSDQIRTLLASGMAPADIARQVGCSRNLVYVVKSKQGGARQGSAKQGGARQKQARRKTAPNARSPRPSTGSNDVAQFLVDLKELERERDELRGVVDQIRQLVSSFA